MRHSSHPQPEQRRECDRKVQKDEQTQQDGSLEADYVLGYACLTCTLLVSLSFLLKKEKRWLASSVNVAKCSQNEFNTHNKHTYKQGNKNSYDWSSQVIKITLRFNLNFIGASSA